jgi:hypothetical protein
MTNDKFIAIGRPLNGKEMSEKSKKFLHCLGTVDDAPVVLIVGGLTANGHDGRRSWFRRIGGRENQICGLAAMVYNVSNDGNRVIGLCKGINDINSGDYQPVLHWLQNRGVSSRYSFKVGKIRYIVLGEVTSVESMNFLGSVLKEYPNDWFIVCVDLLFREFLGMYYKKIKDFKVLGLIVGCEITNSTDEETRRDNGMLHHIVSLDSSSYCVCTINNFGPNLLTTFVKI